MSVGQAESLHFHCGQAAAGGVGQCQDLKCAKITLFSCLIASQQGNFGEILEQSDDCSPPSLQQFNSMLPFSLVLGAASIHTSHGDPDNTKDHL